MRRILGRGYTKWITVLLVLVGLALWRPYVLVEGIQRAFLYAMIALPMALILGIVGIINLAHGEFLMLGAYFAYWLNVKANISPFLAMLPGFVLFFFIGAVSYKATIRYILNAPELNQLLLTFGIAIILQQGANLLWTSRPLKAHLGYVSASVRIGGLSFGIFEFIYVVAALLILYGLLCFLKMTRTGQAARAVGQNPRGARLVGIDVNRTYMLVFSISIALVGAMGALFMTRHSVFPTVGGAFTLKSFCLIAMAGIGNLVGIVWCSLILGISEVLVLSFRGYSGWADIIFFALIASVILIRSRQEHLR